MDFVYIFIFLGISILSSINCKNSAIGMIKEIKTNSPHYPKWYVTPARWIRKLFKVRQHLIPRYLYFELILSLLFAILGPLNMLICVITNFSLDVAGVLIMVHVCLIVLNMIFFSIMSTLLK